MTELNPRERELANALRDTLDKAAARHDPLLDAALAATRAQIAARPQHHHKSWWLAAGGFAVAASLAIVIVLPFGQATDKPPVSMAAVAPMPDTDLELLEDMDMLVAMSEVRNEG